MARGSKSVADEPREWWQRLDEWRARRRLEFRGRHPWLARLVGLSRLGLLVVGAMWLLMVMVWFPNVRAGLGAYVGAVWILVCCIVAARTRTLSGRTCLRVFGLAVPWSVAIGLVSRWLADRMFFTLAEAKATGDVFALNDVEVYASASEAVGASVAIAGVAEEALKLLPLALIVVLAPRRVRRFAIIDWLLLGIASGAAFLAVEELVRRTNLMAPGVMGFCSQGDVTERLECYGAPQFGIWPIGTGSFSADLASYAGHHVLTALVAVTVGLAITGWRAAVGRRWSWAIRVVAIAAPFLMFWIAVVDHMGRNAYGAGATDAWLTADDTSIPAVVRVTFQMTGGGEGRILLLVVLFVTAVVVDALRYGRYGYPVVGDPVHVQRGGSDVAGAGSARGEALITRLMSQAGNDVRRVREVVRDAVGDEVSKAGRLAQRGIHPLLLRGGAQLGGICRQVGRLLWRDIAQGIAAHSREPGESRVLALHRGRSFWLMQRRARQQVFRVEAQWRGPRRFPALPYRLLGIVAVVGLLALGLVAAPWLAKVIGPELTTAPSLGWLAEQLDALAAWWDGLSTTEQIVLGIGAGLVLALPLGFTGGLFVAGIGTYVADHGQGIGDLIEDPGTALADYAATTSPVDFVVDLGELLLTFFPPAYGAGVGVGAKQLAKEYLDDPAAFWVRHRAAMADDAGALQFGAGHARPANYPDWIAYPHKLGGTLPTDFVPGWAAVRQGERGMAYQEQISGMMRLPDGRLPEYVVRNPETGAPVSFDGRILRGDPPQEVFLEAKDGYAELAINPGMPWTRGMKNSIVDQAKRQWHALPDGAVLEWKVSSEAGMKAIRTILDGKGYFDIKVEFVPRKG